MKVGRRMMWRELSPPIRTQRMTAGCLPGPKMLAALGSCHRRSPTRPPWSLKWHQPTPHHYCSCFINFLFCIGIYPINNVVIVSGGQRRNSATHKHVSILPQIPLPSRLPCNIEQSPLCCLGGPCWLSILNVVVCSCPSQTPELSLLPILPPW